MNSPRPRTIKRDVPPACFYYLSIEVPWSLIIIIIFFLSPQLFHLPKKIQFFCLRYYICCYFYSLLLLLLFGHSNQKTHIHKRRGVSANSIPSEQVCVSWRTSPSKQNFFSFFFFFLVFTQFGSSRTLNAPLSSDSPVIARVCRSQKDLEEFHPTHQYQYFFFFFLSLPLFQLTAEITSCAAVRLVCCNFVDMHTFC